MGTSYGDESIDLKRGADRVRSRPASMLGSSKLAGARHGFIELYGNILDEHSAGFGDSIDVVYYKDYSISVRDFGRGVPMGWNSKKNVLNWNWHVIYNELYGGGKYDNYQDELVRITDWANFDPRQFNYLYSVGLNGLGAASTQYTSEFFTVKSFSKGVCKSRSFERGIPLVEGKPYDMFTATQAEIEAIPEEIMATDEPDGTFIHWKPDDTVFEEVIVGSDWLLETCQDVANVAGVDFHFRDENTDTDITIPKGDLTTLVIGKCGGNIVLDGDGNPKVFTNSIFRHGTTKVEGKEFIWVGNCTVAFGMVKRKVGVYCYHNYVKMNEGAQYTAVNDAIYQFMTAIARTRGVKLESSDYENAFCVAVSTQTNYASLRGQTKEGVDDTYIYNMVKDSLKDKLELEYGKGTPEVVEVVERIIREAEIRMSAKEQAKLIREATKTKKEKISSKFVSCDAYENKEYHKAELWITEGDSALGAVKGARDSKFQACYPIRGKGLNAAKASLAKILKNKEIRELFAIIGTGIDLNIKGEKTFNIDDLRFDKIIFATDADEDGYQIRVLLFLDFYKLAPRLITEGHVFIAESPRFRLVLTNGDVLYARNDAERDKLKSKYSVASISRYKGLGEVNADILRETTIAPETRTLIPVTCDLQNEDECDVIDALFGADKYRQRKSAIAAALGGNVADMLDENALMIGSIDEEDIEEETEFLTV